MPQTDMNQLLRVIRLIGVAHRELRPLRDDGIPEAGIEVLRELRLRELDAHEGRAIAGPVRQSELRQALGRSDGYLSKVIDALVSKRPKPLIETTRWRGTKQQQRLELVLTQAGREEVERQLERAFLRLQEGAGFRQQDARALIDSLMAFSRGSGAAEQKALDELHRVLPEDSTL